MLSFFPGIYAEDASQKKTQKTQPQKQTKQDKNLGKIESLLTLDISDNISSDHIVGKTKDAVKEGSLIAEDYLQLLDQNRTKLQQQKQNKKQKKKTKKKKCIFVFISHIDRAFDQSEQDK